MLLPFLAYFCCNGSVVICQTTGIVCRLILALLQELLLMVVLVVLMMVRRLIESLHLASVILPVQ